MRNDLAKVTGSKPCPAGMEFYNSDLKQCQGCPENTYFNYDTNKCVSCDPKKYDINIHKCIQEADPNTYQTNVTTADNLVNGGIPAQQYNDTYFQNQETYPNMQDCPPEAPYFDGINCIMCPSVAPYFNLRTRLCQICPENTSYDPNRKECISTSGSIYNNPDPAKMYANIFHM